MIFIKKINSMGMPTQLRGRPDDSHKINFIPFVFSVLKEDHLIIIVDLGMLLLLKLHQD